MTKNKESCLKKRRSYRNKNMKKEMYLMDCFHLSYAGKAEIFITYKALTKKYVLIITGVHIVEDQYAFTPKYTKRYEFDSLYYCILGFSLACKIIMNGMDWYSPDMFDLHNIYDEITVVVE